MNFPEYDCDNEEILELLSHLPITTVDDYPWMQKYIDDLQWHYKKAEYELAVISAHMIYMFIIYCYILKKKEFNFNRIKADFQSDQEHCPKVITDISPYIYVYKGDKKCFSHLKLDKEMEKRHQNIVAMRDNVAHCSGNTLSEVDFTGYMHKCIENIKQVTNIIWNNFKQSERLNKAIESMIDWNDIVPVFLISRGEFEDLFKEKYNDVIKEKLSDLSLWKNMISKILIANATIKDLKVNIEEIKIRMLDVQDDNAFCFCSANIGLYFEATKNNQLYEKQEQSLNNYPFSFEYNLITNESSIDLTELPSI